MPAVAVISMLLNIIQLFYIFVTKNFSQKKKYSFYLFLYTIRYMQIKNDSNYKLNYIIFIHIVYILKLINFDTMKRIMYGIINFIIKIKYLY